MTIWEKAVMNMQKGQRRLTMVAATFSDRVKTEIAIVRLKIRTDDVQARIDDLYRIIGRKAVQDSTASGSMQQFFKDPDMVTAMTELTERIKERAELEDDLRNAYGELRTTTEPPEVPR